jgi:hypothetical protein
MAEPESYLARLGGTLGVSYAETMLPSNRDKVK